LKSLAITQGEGGGGLKEKKGERRLRKRKSQER